jgi:hypothetical protein
LARRIQITKAGAQSCAYFVETLMSRTKKAESFAQKNATSKASNQKRKLKQKNQKKNSNKNCVLIAVINSNAGKLAIK